MKSFFIISTLVLLFSCCDIENKQVSSTLYDIDIKYISSAIKDGRDMPDSNLWILFDGNYNEDTVTININGKHFQDVVLNTDEKTGKAGDIKTIAYENVKDVSLRINDGKLIYLEAQARHYNIRLTYIDSLATVRFYRRFPGFM